MSASEPHDALFEPGIAWLKQQGCKDVIVEPSKPMSWPRSIPWPAVDLVGIMPEALIVADVKVSREDAAAQLHKTYVMHPKFGVGLHRYIFAPVEEYNQSWPLPDDYGVVVFDDEGNGIEVVATHSFTECNFMAESRMQSRNTCQQQGGEKRPRKLDEKRGLAAECRALLKEYGPMDDRDLARTLTRKLKRKVKPVEVKNTLITYGSGVDRASDGGPTKNYLRDKQTA